MENFSPATIYKIKFWFVVPEGKDCTFIMRISAKDLFCQSFRVSCTEDGQKTTKLISLNLQVASL